MPAASSNHQALEETREELAKVRQVLASKARFYHRLALVGTVVGVVMAVFVGLGAVILRQQRDTLHTVKEAVTATNQRGIENKSLLTNMAKVLAAVESVTSAQARTDQTAATKVLVDGLVCRIEVALQHSDLSLPLPPGCSP